MSVVFYFDGLCEPRNPGGIAAYGFVIYNDGKILMKKYGLACKPWSQDATNNVAEYSALIHGLQWLVDNGFTDNVLALGDSQLVIKQMQGEFRAKAPRIKFLYENAKVLASKFREISFESIPRERNREADSLSRRAYAEYIKGNQFSSA